MKAASRGNENSVKHPFAAHEIDAVVKIHGGATMGGDKQYLVSDLKLL